MRIRDVRLAERQKINCESQCQQPRLQHGQVQTGRFRAYGKKHSTDSQMKTDGRRHGRKKLRVGKAVLLLLRTANSNHTRTTSALLQPYMARTSDERLLLSLVPARLLLSLVPAASARLSQSEDRIGSMRWESEMWFTAAIFTMAGRHAYRCPTNKTVGIDSTFHSRGVAGSWNGVYHWQRR